VIKTAATEPEGIMIDLISRESLADMNTAARIRFIIDEVKLGKVLVLERGLNAKEELELIRATMAEIEQDSFIGVETPGFSVDLKRAGLFDRMLGRSPPPRMMVVGPAHLLKTIRKDGKVVQAMILTRNKLEPMRYEDLPTPSSEKVEDVMGVPQKISEPEGPTQPVPPATLQPTEGELPVNGPPMQPQQMPRSNGPGIVDAQIISERGPGTASSEIPSGGSGGDVQGRIDQREAPPIAPQVQSLDGTVPESPQERASPHPTPSEDLEAEMGLGEELEEEIDDLFVEELSDDDVGDDLQDFIGEDVTGADPQKETEQSQQGQPPTQVREYPGGVPPAAPFATPSQETSPRSTSETPPQVPEIPPGVGTIPSQGTDNRPDKPLRPSEPTTE